MRKNMTAVAALAAATVLAFGIAACGNGGSSDTSSGGNIGDSPEWQWGKENGGC